MAGLPRRMIKETQCLQAEPVPGIKAEPDVSNAHYFHMVIAGPQMIIGVLPQCLKITVEESHSTATLVTGFVWDFHMCHICVWHLRYDLALISCLKTSRVTTDINAVSHKYVNVNLWVGTFVSCSLRDKVIRNMKKACMIKWINLQFTKLREDLLAMYPGDSNAMETRKWSV
eukprot:bmy_01288T0